MGILSSLVICRACDHAEVGHGWAICRGIPWDGIPGQALNLKHPCGSFRARTEAVPPPKRIPMCKEGCPWYRENPWTHYPELPFWCDWHFDHLIKDNPACIGFRRGEIPKTRKLMEVIA